MEYRNLEITVCSAKDLKDVNTFSKMDVYVVVMIAEDPRTKQLTPVDKDGGKSPKWNHKMKFVIDESAAKQNRLTLQFQIKSERTLGDKEIGEVSVPLKELFDKDGDDEGKKTERIVTYNVVTPSGKSKGTLNFAYKIGDKVDPATFQFSEKTLGNGEPVMAYPTGSTYPYYPPQQGAPPPMYQQPPPPGAPPGYMYPPPGAPGYMYPPPGAPGYPPQMAPGYGGYPPQGYGYQPQVEQKKKKSGMGGMGLGLAGGLLGGLLIGDMISDVGEASAYDDGGGFDF